MYCMDCGLEIPEDAKFCKKCSMPLTTCSECGEELPRKARFCWKCGKEQAGAAILSASDKDPESILPQHSDAPSLFARIGAANKAPEAPQPGASSPFKPAGSVKRESRAASSYNAAVTPSAFKPASAKKNKKELPPANKAPEAPGPFKPLGSAKKEAEAPRTTAPAVSGAFRPMASRQVEKEAPKAAPQAAAAFSPFKPLESAKKETASRAAPAAPAASAPAASSALGAFKPLGSGEPAKETPKAAPAFAAFKPAASKDETDTPAKRPGNPSRMFNMNSSGSGSLSSLGGSDSGSLSSLGGSDSGSLSSLSSFSSDDSGDPGDKLPQRSESSPSRFFPGSAPKKEPQTPMGFAGNNPFKPINSKVESEDKPYVREQGASPFKPLGS